MSSTESTAIVESPAPVLAQRPARLPCPAPGIYKGVENEVYHSWEACNNSSLSTLFDSSPMHVRYAQEHPKEPTPALVFGTAFHTLMLEPEVFEKTYQLMPDFGPMQSSKNRAVRDAWLAANPGVKCLKQEEFDQLFAMQRSTLAYRGAEKLLTEDQGNNEVAIVFDHPEFPDMRCKIKVDMLRPKLAVIGDLKTTESASPRDIERSIADYGYHRQAAFYVDACAQVGIPIEYFLFIFVEKKAPYGVGLYRLRPESIELGRQELRPLLSLYATCKRNNVWPGFNEDFIDCDIPRYKAQQIMNPR